MKKLTTYITALLFCFSLSVTAQKDTLITNVINLSGDPEDLLTELLIGSILPAEFASLIPTSVCPGDRLMITVDTTGGNYADDNFFIAELVDDPLGGLGGALGGLGGGLLPDPPTYYLGENRPGGGPIDLIGGFINTLLDGVGVLAPSIIAALAGGGGLGDGPGVDPGDFSLALGTQTIIGTIPDDIPDTNGPFGGYYMRVTSSNPVGTSVYYPGSFTVKSASTPIITLLCGGNGENIYLMAPKESAYLWSTGETTQTIAVPNDDHVYSLRITNAGKCQASADTAIVENEIVVACDVEGGASILSLSSDLEAAAYFWSTQATDYLIELDETMQAENALYVLATETPFSCTAVEATVCPPGPPGPPGFYGLLEESGIYVPSIFTPNNDNVNDLFLINNTDNRIKSLSIFTPWGNEVYHSENLIRPWGGYNQTGVECPDGTYFYVMELNDSAPADMPQKGFFTLLR